MKWGVNLDTSQHFIGTIYNSNERLREQNMGY